VFYRLGSRRGATRGKTIVAWISLLTILYELSGRGQGFLGVGDSTTGDDGRRRDFAFYGTIHGRRLRTVGGRGGGVVDSVFHGLGGRLPGGLVDTS